jgi:sec-independent protein translocase protein TatA
MPIGPTELILILVLVTIFFGVGRLPEVFGSVGKGLREFRNAVKEEEQEGKSVPTVHKTTVESKETPAEISSPPPQ